METPDISAYLQFQFYKCVYYLDPIEKYPATKYKPARWLGVAPNVGDKMTFCLLSEETKRIIEQSSITAARDVIDKTVHWDPDLDHNVTDKSQTLTQQCQHLNCHIAQERWTCLTSKKQLRHMQHRGNTSPAMPPQGEACTETEETVDKTGDETRATKEILDETGEANAEAGETLDETGEADVEAGETDAETRTEAGKTP